MGTNNTLTELNLRGKDPDIEAKSAINSSNNKNSLSDPALIMIVDSNKNESSGSLTSYDDHNFVSMERKIKELKDEVKQEREVRLQLSKTLTMFVHQKKKKEGKV